MEIKRKIEVFAATNRRYVVRQQTSELQIVCPTCDNAMLAVEAAARMFHISQRNAFQLVEAGTVHFMEIEGAAAMICITTLADAIDRQGKNLI